MQYTNTHNDKKLEFINWCFEENSLAENSYTMSLNEAKDVTSFGKFIDKINEAINNGEPTNIVICTSITVTSNVVIISKCKEKCNIKTFRVDSLQNFQHEFFLENLKIDHLIIQNTSLIHSIDIENCDIKKLTLNSGSTVCISNSSIVQ